jgi:TolB-like protein
MAPERKNKYEFGRFRLDLNERALFDGEDMVSLPPKLFDTLVVLVEYKGRVVEKEELMQRVWPDSFVEENNINKNIYALRKLFGEEQDFIETIPKRGYRFVAKVREGWSVSDEIIVKTRTTGRLIIEEEIEPEPKLKTIAVLPFKTFGNNGSSDYLGLGLADALITRLSNAQQITVRPTSSIVKYNHAAQDLFIIGQELRVDAVLEGSIRRQEPRIRVTVQLVSIKEEATLWAGKFDESFTDIFAVEDIISERVADALTLSLSGKERALLTKHHTENIEAYEWLLKGIYYVNRHTPEALGKAIEAFTEATLKDPNYALAFTWLSGCSSLIYFRNISAPPAKEVALKAKLYAEKALSLDDSLAEAHVVYLAAMLYHDFDFSGVEKEINRVVAMNPKGPPAHRWCGIYLGARGRFGEALQIMQQACDADPLSSVGSLGMGNIYFYMREYDKAIAAFARTLELEPNSWEARLGLAALYAIKGQYGEALAELDKPFIIDEARRMAIRGYVYARSGDQDQARRILEELHACAAQSYVNPREMATLHAALGDFDQAFMWIDQAYEEHYPWLLSINVDFWTEPLRFDPRFTSLLRRIGLQA